MFFLYRSVNQSCLFFFFPPQNCNYFVDSEVESVRMMEDVEKLCDRLELMR